MTNNITRIIRITLYLVVLCLLVLFGSYNNPTITLAMCDADPIKYDNAFLEIGNEITVKTIYPDSFIVHQNGKLYKVVGRSKNLIPNQFISLKANYHRDGWLELVDYHVSEKRRVKIWVSVLPVFIVLIIFFKQFRFSFKNFYFKRV